MKNIIHILLILTIFSSCREQKKLTNNKVSTIETIKLVLKPEKLNIDKTSNIILNNWVDYYRSLEPSFSLDNFFIEKVDTLNFIQGNVFGNFDKEFNKIYTDFIVFSPNQKQYIDFDSYHWSIDETNTPIFSPDQEINLIDVKNQTVKRIGFNGPSQWVENVFWKDDTTVILLENSNERILRISEINVINQKIKIFKYKSIITIKSDYSEQRLVKKGLK